MIKFNKINEWIIRINNKSFITWQKGNENRFINITTQEYNSEAYGYKRPIDYPISIGTCSTNEFTKTFKTKKQAIEFAKKYMQNEIELLKREYKKEQKSEGKK